MTSITSEIHEGRLELFSLKKRRARGGLINVYKYTDRRE